MDFPVSPKSQRTEDLGVTSISRSGRIRKKSSKLMDFDSSEDVSDMPQRQMAQQVQKLIDKTSEPGPSGCQMQKSTKNYASHSSLQATAADHELESSEVESQLSDSDSDDAQVSNNQGIRGTASESEDNNLLALPIGEGETGFTKLEPPEQGFLSQANSLYMQEKNKKKIIIKDGKIIGGAKAQRKDKGKARFTAYMLWAKEIRQKLVAQFPDMDFATVSKRLGDLWATVPNLEKCNWRRRAKRLVFNPTAKPALKNESVWKIPRPALSNKFINKIRNVKEQRISNTKKPKQHGGRLLMKNFSISPSSSHSSRVDKSVGNKRSCREVGTAPVDVAAHLTLLGESLTVIGELLTNHDGEIAVSGSLSVLLDSLLCALGPLICLTQQVPETNGVDPQTLSKTLDNLAYIMPGL